MFLRSEIADVESLFYLVCLNLFGFWLETQTRNLKFSDGPRETSCCCCYNEAEGWVLKDGERVGWRNFVLSVGGTSASADISPQLFSHST